MSTPVDTPAYGLKTPLGILMIASSLWFSINSFRIALCALDVLNRTLSGTIVAPRPPFFRRRINKLINNSSVCFVFVIFNKSSETDSSSKEPVNGGFAKTSVYFSLSLFRSEEHTSELQSRGHLV